MRIGLRTTVSRHLRLAPSGVFALVLALSLCGCQALRGGATPAAATPDEAMAAEEAQGSAEDTQQAYAPAAVPAAELEEEPGEELTEQQQRVLYQRGLKARDRRIYDVAFDYFRRASNAGYGPASLAAGKSLAAGYSSLPQDYALAARYYRLAVDRGVGYLAELPLGALYVEGLGVPQDSAEAERWFRRAAFTVSKLEGVVKQGAASGQQGGRELLLATLFSPHRYPPQFDDALAWLADLNRQDGELAYIESLGYRDGNGVPQDDVLADLLLELAALRDYPQAAYELGLAKLEGSEEERDWPGGMVMLWRAAKGDLIIAQRELALRYREAEGDDLNRQRAFYWLLRAQRNGDEVEEELAAAASDLSDLERDLVVRNLDTDYVYTP